VRKFFCVLAFLLALCFPKGVLAQQPIRVNCGGASYTDSKGQVWAADYGFNSGGVYSTASSISGTSDQKLYQTARYGDAVIYILRGCQRQLYRQRSPGGDLLRLFLRADERAATHKVS